MIVVMASGDGGNFEAIVNIGIKVNLVITNKEDAVVINRATRLGVHCVVSNKDYEQHVPKDTKLVILAGFMKLLSPKFVEKFKTVNIHPSLLPSFKGAHAVKQSLDAGVKISGCTVHWVDKGMDTGKIISQLSCCVLDNDSEESLSEKIHLLEHKIYPETIKELIKDITYVN